VKISIKLVQARSQEIALNADLDLTIGSNIEEVLCRSIFPGLPVYFPLFIQLKVMTN